MQSESEADMLARLQKELEGVTAQKKKNAARVQQSYSNWLIEKIGRWAKSTFLN